MPSMVRSLRAGWPTFGLWAVCGSLWTFSVLSFAGPFAWPVAGLLTAWLISATKERRDAVGLLGGVGLFFLFVGVVHIADDPCPPGPISGSCGGLDSAPWLAADSLLIVIAVEVYRRLLAQKHQDQAIQ